MALGSDSLVLLGVVISAWIAYSTTKRPRRPPGPRRLPLIGNLLSLPTKLHWLKYTEWAKQYGDLVYVEALGHHLLIVNSLKVANDLLVKRAENYTDRPKITMAGELMGLDNSFFLLPYKATWKLQRKLCRAGLGPAAVLKYQPFQEESTVAFLRGLLTNPTGYFDSLRFYTEEIIMGIAYGIPAGDFKEDYLVTAEAAQDYFLGASLPGSHIVDILPWLKHLPSWIPFNSIPKEVSAGRKLLFASYDEPFDYVKKKIETDESRPGTFVEDTLISLAEQHSSMPTEERDFTAKWVAGTLLGAGGGTTQGVILNFILAMAEFPAVQARLKAELDEVVGPERLPDLKDLDNMPYLVATRKEAVRWRPVAPLSVPRMARNDDIYEGYHIPAGTVVIPNLHSISQDHISGIPSEDFAPERFLSQYVKQTAIETSAYSFGFGRRECPGRFLGEKNLFYFLSYLVHCFEIQSTTKEPIPVTYISSIVSHPNEFPIKFIPRPYARTLLESYSN
ncbi:cytochrome P450 [Flagelloscypha sp. PMI_526]|nr:cytochrome P450 [Flagelloscypha sp. PMI_526]